MGLVRHIDGYRRIWMFPRNIRAIYPWKISQILALMLNLIQRGEWSQGVQDQFCKALEEAGLKRHGVQYDPHSGGPRTYFSQLKCLGLIFTRSDGSIFPTLAGQDLADGKPPLPIMQTMLLRLQYPSAYSGYPNVRINPLIEVKPFLFVLDLLNIPEIGSLSVNELFVPMIYGHNDECLDICTEKILRIRAGCNLKDIIDDLETDLYLPRSRAGVELKIANVLDIANTCKNYLKSCCLVSEDRASGEQRIYFSEDARELYERASASRDRLITVNSEEGFQRTFGAWNRTKDTRSLVGTTFDARAVKEGIILSSFYQLCGRKVVVAVPDDFVEKMRSEYGFSRVEILDIVGPHLSTAIDFFESTFLDSAKGGATTAQKFELSLTELLHNRFKFFAKHTGQIRRPGVGGYADVFIVADDFMNCAILDAKASPSYSLSSDDYSKLVSNYVPNYRELLDKFEETRGKNIRLEFCSYVAGGFFGDITFKLRQAFETTGVPCSAIRARDLLRLAKSDISQPVLRNGFATSKILEPVDFSI